MCEILLCVKNMGTSGDLAIDSHAPQIGDVIDVHPDGWTWGECELGGPTYTDETGTVQPIQNHINGNHPFFRIVKLPNVNVAQASRMLTPELPVDPLNPSPYLQYRGFFLDKSKFTEAHAALAAHIADDLRTNQFISLPYTAAQINSIVSQRATIAF